MKVKFYFIIALLLAGAKCSHFFSTTPRDNLYINSIDRGEVNPDQDTLVYYKIFINKELSAKTEAALFFQSKKNSFRLPEGKYLFFVERWELEKRTGDDGETVQEYRRSNNVWQMGSPIYVEIFKDKSFVDINFGYDHSARLFYLEKNYREK